MKSISMRVLIGASAGIVALGAAKLPAMATESEEQLYAGNMAEGERHRYDASELNLPDNDELFSMYVESRFSAEQNGILRSGAAQNSTLNAYEKRYYDAMAEKIKLIADGRLSSSEISIPFSTVYPASRITAADLGLSAVAVNGRVTQEALDKISVDQSKVYECLLMGFPYEMYWSARNISSGGGLYTENVTVIDGNTLEIDGTNLEMSLYVSKDYNATHTDAETTDLDVSVTGATRNAVANAANIVNEANGKSDYEKLAFYKDKICELVSYNDDAAKGRADSANPWEIIWVFDNDPSTNVVCEGYAKAFNYLCDSTTFASSAINCYLVTGTTDEAHMWNVVHMNDGKNYLVDVTNCDEDSIGYPNGLFLAGSNKKETVENNHLRYSISGQDWSMTYTYDDQTHRVYTLEELTLATSTYDPNNAVDNPTDNPVVPDNPNNNPEEAEGARAFVRSLYQVGLGREPEEAGLNDWTNKLTSGQKKAVDIVQGVLCSPEYLGKGKSNGDMVTDCYKAMLNRTPDEAGYSNWVSNLDSGMSVNAIFAGFVGSDEFGNLCAQYGIEPGTYNLNENRDKNAGVTKFVSRLYTEALGRGYDVGGLNDWCGQIISNPSKDNIMNVATNGFFHSSEFMGKNLNNTDFVKVLYRTFLGRDYDEAGLNSWVGLLDRGEKTRDEVMEGFAYSQEFTNIMASYGL